MLKVIYNSQNLEYKKPFGAVPINENVVFNIKVNTLCDTKMIIKSENGLNEFNLEYARQDGDYFIYSIELDVSDYLGPVFYYFVFKKDNKTFYYTNKNDLLGGEGRLYEKNPDLYYHFYVYDLKYNVPDWFKTGIVYHVFVEDMGFTEYILLESDENSDKNKSVKEYYSSLLGEYDVVSLPSDMQADYKNEYHDAVAFDIDGEDIYEFCKTYNCPIPVLFLSATILNLNKYLKSNKMMFFTVFNGRYSPRMNTTVGCIAKSLLFHSDISDNTKTLNQLFHDTQETYTQLLAFEPNHFVYDYSKIENEFEFNYMKMDDSDVYDGGVTIEDCPGNAVRDNTIFVVNDTGDKMTLNIYYKGHIYTEKYISEFLEDITELIQRIIRNNPHEICIGEFIHDW